MRQIPLLLLIPLALHAAACLDMEAPAEDIAADASLQSLDLDPCDEGSDSAYDPNCQVALDLEGEDLVPNDVTASAISPAPVLRHDANGDGLADLLLQYDEGGVRRWQVQLSNGSFFTNAGDWTTTTTANVKAVGFADTNGDGLSDLLLQYDANGTRRWQVRVSTGSSFASVGNWSSTSMAKVEAVAFADVNGDGLADLLLQFDLGGTRHWQMRLSTGSTFANGSTWTTTTSSNVKTVGLADVDGDGLADLVLQYNSGSTRYWQVRRSTGTSFANAQNWTSTTSGGVEAVGLSDMNGDGLADLLVQWHAGGERRWQGRLSDGSSFANISQWSSTTSSKVEAVSLSDINGDGSADLLLQWDRDLRRRWQGRLSDGTSFGATANWASTNKRNVNAVPGTLYASPAIPSQRYRRFCSVPLVYSGYQRACGGHLQPACPSGAACDPGHKSYTGSDFPLVIDCPIGSNETVSAGCYDEIPTCNDCGGDGQVPCPASAEPYCDAGCDAGLESNSTTTLCEAPGTPGTPCGPGYGCGDGLTCDPFSGFVCIANAQAGESCANPFVVCDASEGLQCTGALECSHSPALQDETCDVGTQCSDGLFCQVGIPQRCKPLRAVGQGCSLLNPCGPGGKCESCFQEGCTAPFQCFMDNDEGPISEEACLALYSPFVADRAIEAGVAMTFGVGNGAAIGVTEAQEFGVAYGPYGEFGCYVGICGGLSTSVGISHFVALGLFTTFEAIAGTSFSSVQEAGLSDFFSFSTSQIFARESSSVLPGALIGTVDAVSIGAGISPPLSLGLFNCDTEMTVVY